MTLSTTDKWRIVGDDLNASAGGKLTGVGSPTDSADAATKGYIDARVAGVASEYSVACKPDAGSGALSSLTIAAQSLIIRAAGNVVNLAIGANRVLARTLSGDLASTDPNDLFFVKHVSYHRAGYAHHAVGTVLDTENEDFAFVPAAPYGDGEYSFMVEVMAVASGGGAKYRRTFLLQIDRVAGVFTGAQLATPIAPDSCRQDAELVCTFSDSGGGFPGNLVCNVENAIGEDANIDVYFAVGHIQWNVAPDDGF